MCIHVCPRGHVYFMAPCAYDIGSKTDYEQRWPDAEERWEDFAFRWRIEQIEAEAVHVAVCAELPGAKGAPRLKEWGFHRFQSRPGRQTTLC